MSGSIGCWGEREEVADLEIGFPKLAPLVLLDSQSAMAGGVARALFQMTTRAVQARKNYRDPD